MTATKTKNELAYTNDGDYDGDDANNDNKKANDKSTVNRRNNDKALQHQKRKLRMEAITNTDKTG